MKRIFLAIPTLSGKCLPGTEASIEMFAMEAESCGWEFVQFRWAQDSLIAHARNVCMAKFMESNCTDMLFLDSDVACGPGVFSRLMTHDADVVAGVYRVKNDEERYPVVPIEGGAVQDTKTGLLEVKDIPFGLVRIRREVIEKMTAAEPDNWFYANNAERMKCQALFNTEIRDHTFWGEDYYFCRKWRALGGKIYVDPEFRLAHVNGDGKAFTGSFAEWLRKQNSVEKPVNQKQDEPKPAPDVGKVLHALADAFKKYDETIAGDSLAA